MIMTVVKIKERKKDRWFEMQKFVSH